MNQVENTFEQELKLVEKEDSREIFKHGDVVMLKSGGKPMTVDSFAPVTKEDGAEGLATCIWMSNDGQIQGHIFDSRTLDNLTAKEETMELFESATDESPELRLNFIGAMMAMSADSPVMRAVWPDGQRIEMVAVDGVNRIVTFDEDGDMMDWTASSDDLLAFDWIEISI